jgi:hypothetical protein
MFIPDHLRDAIDLCKKAGLSYRYEHTSKGHILFYIGSQSIVGMSGARHNRDGDKQIYFSVMREVRRAIEKEKR